MINLNINKFFNRNFNLKKIFFFRYFCNNVNQLRSKNFKSVKELISLEPTDTIYKVKGWISSSVKRQKNVTFFHLNDGLSNDQIQVVIRKHKSSLENSLTYGSSLIFTGKLIESIGNQQKIEFLAEDLLFTSECVKFPFTNKEEGHLQNIRQNLHLRTKSSNFCGVLRLRSKLIQFIHEYMKKNFYFNVATPLITSNDCEGGGDAFYVKTINEENYFEKSTYLTVSGQLHLEAVVLGVPKVYNFSPCFRAEYSLSRRHLCEFTMFEVEELFFESLDSLMDTVENILKQMAKFVLNNCEEEIYLIFKEDNNRINYIPTLCESKYSRITYDIAVDILNSKNDFDFKYGSNLNTIHENYLLKNFNNCPIFITNYPILMKPFYMKANNDKALNFDLIFPVCGEICGGSLREDNFEIIEKKFEIYSFKKSFDWYKELKKESSLPHGGFGIGFDRFIQCVLNFSNIRDVVPFPRWLHNCYT